MSEFLVAGVIVFVVLWGLWSGYKKTKERMESEIHEIR